METSETEIYKKFRPKSLDGMIGQETAVKQVETWIKKNKIPRTILITGPSGCGKTTLARIIKNQLEIGEADYQEVDCADTNGIDMVRSLKSRVNASPLSGAWRMFVLDECHQLTAAAQDSLLKILEDTPKHVVFVLSTTDGRKLKETIRTRSSHLEVKSLLKSDIVALMKKICKKLKANIETEVLDTIAEAAKGSARRSLVLLHQIIDLDSTEAMIAAITRTDEEAVGIDLARKLTNLTSQWSDIAEVLKRIEIDAEGVRRAVLGYASAILLNQKSPQTAMAKRCALLLESFESNLFDSGKAGLTLQAFNCFSMRN